MSGERFLPSPDEITLSVEWNRPQSDALILHYEIRYWYHTGSFSWQGPVNAIPETVTVHIILVTSTSYGVQVRAVSAIGKGLYSSEKTIKCVL